MILREAARLFCEYGFHGTSMSEIGAAAGVKGPTVYRHFSDKNAVLVALIEQSADRSETDVAQVDRDGGTPAESLARLIRVQVRQAVEDGPLTVVAAREVRSLPAETSRPLLRRARLNHEEWMRLLARARPELAKEEVHALVVGVKWLIFTLATGRTGMEADRLHRLVAGMVLDVLLPERPRRAEPG